MPRAGIALGSNLGPRLANLQAARELLRRLARPGDELLQAPVYQTAPFACPDGSPDRYPKNPHLSSSRESGRRRSVRHGCARISVAL